MNVLVFAVLIGTALAAPNLKRCSSQGIFSHHDDCRKFILCTDDLRQVENDCPDNLEYNPLTKKCDWPQGFCTVQGKLPVERVMNCQESSSDVHTPDYANDCKTFYYCYEGVPRIGQCPQGKIFDKSSNDCVDQRLVRCHPVNDVQNKIELDCSSDIASSPISNVAEKCISYYHCVDGKAVKSYCEGNLVFNSVTGKCDRDDGTCELKSCASTRHGFSTVDLTDCRNYLECNDGEFKRKTCLQGMYFDFAKGRCVINNGQCIVDANVGQDCGNLANGLFAPDHSHCVDFFVCMNGNLRKLSCPAGQYFNAISLQCTNDDGTCPLVQKAAVVKKGNCGDYTSGQRIKNSDDCTRFSICVNGELLAQQCPTGQYFNADYGTCLLNTGACNSQGLTAKPRPESKTSQDCENLPNGHFRGDIDNCAKFFVCSVGTLMHLACPAGQYFNKDLLQCAEDNGLCRDVKQTSVELEESVPAKEVTCGEVLNGEMVKAESDCQSYKICVNGEMISQKCQDGEYFNENTRTCLPDNGVCKAIEELMANCGTFADGQFVPDLSNCVSYFTCVRGDMKKLNCPEGQYFNTFKLDCVDDDGTCADVIVPKSTPAEDTITVSCGIYSNGESWPNDQDCQSYYICYNGETVQQTCQSGLFFDAVARICVANKGRCACAEAAPVVVAEPECGCGNYTNGEFWTDLENCAAFFVCVDGTIRNLLCPDGQYFNGRRRQCIPDDGTCDDVVPTPEPSPCCGDSSNGQRTPDPENCYNYYMCYNGDWVSQACPSGQYFNSTTGCCLPGKCTSEGTEPPITESPSTVPPTSESTTTESPATESSTTTTTTTESTSAGTEPPITESPSTVPPTSESTTTESPATESSTTTTTTTESTTTTTSPATESTTTESSTTGTDIPGTPSGENKCQFGREEYDDGVFIPLPGDCAGFGLCCNGTVQTFSCPSGHYWNQAIGVCSQIVNEEDCPSPKSCGNIANGEFTQADDCKDYYVCSNGQLVLLSCRDGYYYNGADEICVPDNYQCRTTTTTTTTTIRPRPAFENCGAFGTGDKISTTDCHDYFICVDGDLVKKSCPVGYHYDSNQDECLRGSCVSEGNCGEYANGEFIPVEDCFDYQICCNGNLADFTCPSGYYFNATTKICTPGDCQVKCSVGELRPASNCLFYERCDVDGVWVEEQCDEGFYFDAETSSCAVNDNNQCVGRCNCGGLSNGDMEDGDYCGTYKLCFNCNLLIAYCEDGYVFNNITKDCEPDASQSCTISPITDLSCFLYPNGTIIQDVNNCRGYFTCANGLRVTGECYSNEYYDPTEGDCKVEDCSAVSTTESSAMTTAMEPDIAICSPECYGTYVADKTDCTSYYICYYAIPLPQTCPDGQYFDSDTRACRSDRGQCVTANEYLSPLCYGLHGVMLPHVTDCNKFYICVNGETIVYKCKDGELFNPTSTKCEPDTNKQCQTSALVAKLGRNDREENIIDCREQSSGTLHKNPLDCSAYYVCSNGYAIPSRCPTGYSFDSASLLCKRDDGSCGKSFEDYSIVARSMSSSLCEGLHGVFQADVNDCSKFFVCTYGKAASHEKCNEGEYFSKETLQCTRNTGHCIVGDEIRSNLCVGKIEGAYIPDSEDCTKFRMCSKGYAIPQQCDQGLFFDPVHRYCRKNDGSCSKGLTDKSESQQIKSNLCYEKHGVFVAGEKCGEFHLCVNELSVTISQCAPGLYFDTKAQNCVYDYKQTCSSTARATSVPSCLKLSSKKFYANVKESCQTFFKCENNVPHQYTCPNGLIFNTLLQQCDYPEFTECADEIIPLENATCSGELTGVRHANLETECRSFFVCVEGEMIEKFCPDGMLYNSELDVCDWPFMVECSASSGRRKRATVESSGHSGLDNRICREVEQNKFFGNGQDFCTTFFQCVNGAVYTYTCPPGLLFNSMSNTCDYPSTSICYDHLGKRVRNPPCMDDETGTLIENDANDCQSFYICNNHIAIEQFCQDGMKFNAETQVCDWPQNVRCGVSRRRRSVGSQETPKTMPSCKNAKEDKFYGVADDNCQSFYKCIGNQAFVQTCPPGLVFNSLKDECDWPQNGRCFDVNGVSISQPPCLGAESGTFVENLANGCESFFMCVNDVAIEQYCHNGMRFNAESNVCDWPQNVQCGVGHAKRRRRDVTENTKAKISINCKDVIENTFYGLASDQCHSFFNCIGGKAFVYECPPGLVFNSLEEQCDWPENTECRDISQQIIKKRQKTCKGQRTGTLIENLETNCQSYFICEHDNGIERFCPEGMLFNEVSQTCDWPSNVRCGVLVPKREKRSVAPKAGSELAVKINCADVIENTFYGIASEQCRSFFSCIGDKSFVYECPPGLVFNSMNQQCDWPETTECRDISEQIIKKTQKTCMGQKTGTLIENLDTNCQSYFICEHDKGIESFCPEGMLFNEASHACDWPSNVRCGILVAKRGKRSTNAVLPSCSNLEENVFYGIKEDECRTFFKCIENNAHVYDCPDGLVFNMETAHCDYPAETDCRDHVITTTEPPPFEPCQNRMTGTIIENLENGCESFFICDNNMHTETFCPEGMLFNAEKNVCDWPDNVKCGGTEIRRKRSVAPKAGSELAVKINCQAVVENTFYGIASEQCRSFFSCIGDKAFVYECPPGLVFNSINQQCDWPETTECRDISEQIIKKTQKTCMGQKTGALIENLDTNCQSYFICEHDKGIESFCPEGMLFNEASQACDWPSNVRCGVLVAKRGKRSTDAVLPSCSNLEENVFYGIKEDECRTFFKCIENNAYVYDCPDGLVFNMETAHCDYPAETDCRDHVITTTEPPPFEPCQDRMTGTIIENLENGCESFFICDNNMHTEKFCPEGMLFNAEKSVCDWPDNVKCGETEIRRKRSVTSGETTRLPNCRDVIENTFYGLDSDQCHSFFNCIGGKAFVYECPPGLVFNSVEEQCDWPENTECRDISEQIIKKRQKTCKGQKTGTLIENLETNCQSYFICEHDNGIERFCPEGMLFNEVSQTCDWPSNVRCGVLVPKREKRSVVPKAASELAVEINCKDVIENTFYGIASEQCRSFFSCIGDKAFVFECPPELVFNSTQQQCDWPETTECRDISEQIIKKTQKTCKGQKTGTLIENLDTNCQSYFICEHDKGIESFCPEGMLFNEASQACDWPSNVRCRILVAKRGKRSTDAVLPSCSNLEENLFYGIKEDECQTFFKCIENNAYVYNCPDGLVFNMEKAYCDYPEETECRGPVITTTTTTEPPPFQPCQDRTTGTLLENLENGCESFFICDNNMHTETFCPEGMLFNAETNVCDWPDNVKCGKTEIRRKRSVTSGETTRLPSCVNAIPGRYYGVAEDKCKSFYQCVGHHPFVSQCPPGLVFNSLKDECDWPKGSECFDINGVSIIQPPCIGAKSGTLLDNLETGCRSYYICENNKAIEQFCPDGMLFNSKSMSCDWPQNVQCGAHQSSRKKRSVNDVNLPSCSYLEDGIFYGVEADECRTFFKCVDHRAFVYECPAGLVFNTEKNYCDYPSKTQCRGPEIITTSTKPFAPCRDQAPGTLLENPETGCQSFFMCDNNNMHLEKFCQSGMLFNAESNVCDWPQNVQCGKMERRHKRSVSAEVAPSLPSCVNAKPGRFYGVAEDKCKSFYQCVENHPFVSHCPPGLMFNSLKDQCDWPEGSECFDINGVSIIQPPCIGAKSGTLLDNIQTGCQSYFICENNKAIEQFCPDGMLFNSKSQSCDWPQNVQCGAHWDHRRRREVAENLPDCTDVESNRLYGLTSDECRTFFQCVGGKAMVYTCPSGLRFNFAKNECDYPGISRCVGPEIDEGLEPCRGRLTGDRIPNYRKGCHSFYVCDHGKAVENFCQNGMLYNPKLDVCDYPKNVECRPESGNKVFAEFDYFERGI